MSKDHYQILGVSKLATKEAITAAYLKLQAKYKQLDQTDPATLQSLKDIEEAYKVLNDTKSRAAYNQGNRVSKSFQNFQNTNIRGGLSGSPSSQNFRTLGKRR